MSREFYQLAKEILVSTLSQPADQRDEFLRQACGERADLLAEVQSLLAQQDAPSSLVDEGLVHLGSSIPSHIGPYEVIEVLGEGGMGVVYRGRQVSPIKREVAIKVLHAGLNTARILERFAWERRSLARMNHPNIASILDAGSAEDGHPYVVLELIEGVPVTTWCRERGGSVGQRLAMMEKVCQAVQHAHDRGVLHRDLKPGNILVREIDGQPTPCIIDFGIAKALDDTQSGEAGIELTMEGQQVGTPAYMSPEQLVGRSDEVDVRTDVYALGVILYELLAGQRPFSDEHLGRSKRRDKPMRPSRVSERRELKGDLDNICLMAIRPEAGRRYRSAADLAGDLSRYREGQPVLASPDSWRYRTGKTARRHPALVALTAAALVFVLAGVSFLAYHARRLDIERDRALVAESLARQEADAAEEIAAFLEGLFLDMDPVEAGPAATTALELLDNGAARLVNELPDQPATRARLWDIMGQVNQNIARHEVAESQARLALAAYAEVPDSTATWLGRARAFDQLSTALHDMGRYAESEIASRHTLAFYSRAAPELDAYRLRIITGLAIAIQAQGRLIEAQNMFQDGIVLSRSLGEAGATEGIFMQDMRGYILYKRGYYREALADVTAALAANRRLLPGDSIDLASSLNNVGGINYELGNLDLAETHILELKVMLERIFQGNDNPAITRAIFHLANIAMAKRDTAAALAGYEAAYEQSVQQLGLDNPSSWRTAEGLAKARYLQGRWPEAVALQLQALAGWEENAGDRNIRTLACRHRLGRLYLDTGDLIKARRELELTVAGYEQDFEPNHPQLHRAGVDLAALLLEDGDNNGARVLLQKAVPILVETYGNDADDCVRARGLLAKAG